MRGSYVADYAAHAHKAQELLDASEKWAKAGSVPTNS